jgi:Tol biopolymer transport system component/tRNA A-37 threonylcarbamoyl transferase component Bud32
VVGRTIAHYHLIAKLGAGGMGVVYKARDSRLNRFVAIKVLPPELVADPERKRRFIHEARSASALNHPHIVTIHDIGTDDGADFIVMEYVDGKDLGQIIPPQGLPPREALNYACQIAAALAAAHAQGIVHRDVKPGNIMITHGGVAKVLDFGLAKLTEWTAGDDVSTRTIFEGTSEEVLVGTIPYMSPEQVKDHRADTRSDIFSFGVLLYEMLTGRRPFQAANSILTIASILRDEPPPPSSINPQVWPELDRVVARCLEKEPERRFQNAADLQIVLEWLTRDTGIGKPASSGTPSAARRWKFAPRASLTIVAAAAAIAAAVYGLRPRPAPPPFKVTRVTTSLGYTCNPALSGDGRLFAYASDRDGGKLHIWVQQLPGGQPIQKTRGEAEESSPRFSPDGATIVFERTGAGIFTVPVFGDAERLIAPRGHDPQFSPDGTRIAFWIGDPDSSATSGAVFVTPFARYAPRQLAEAFAGARFPVWAPDGAHILFEGLPSSGAQPELWVAATDGGAPVSTGIFDVLRNRHVTPVSAPGDWKGNDFVFSAVDSRVRHIWRAKMKVPGWRLARPAEQVTFGPGEDADPSLGPGGRLAFSTWTYHNSLWRLPLHNGGPTQPNLERLSQSGELQSRPSISDDARTLAFLSSGASGYRQVFTRDMKSGVEKQLTFGPENKSAPVIAGDGSRVAYTVVENNRPSIYVVALAPSDSAFPAKVCDDCGEPSGWTHTGGILSSSGHPRCISLIDPGSGSRSPFLCHPVYDLDQAQLSPDGRWIAFVARAGSDSSRIYIAPFRNGSPSSPALWIPVTGGAARDDKPRWLDGDLLYFSNRDGFGCIWKQELRPDTMQLAGAPTPVHHFHNIAQSPRTLFRSGFQIAVTRTMLILNLVDITGDVWLVDLP